MMRFPLISTVLVSLVLLAGCGNSDYSRNKDGLIYRIINTGKGDLIKPKTYLKVHQMVSLDDSTLFTTFGKIPAYGFFDSLQTPTHDFLDILDQMRIGDSAIVIRYVDTLVKRGMMQYNEQFKKGSTIKVVFKVLGAFENEGQLDEDRNKEIEAYKQSEIVKLGEYLKAEKINATKTPEGVYVLVEKEGTGAKIDSGQFVSVKYTGRLKDGTVFDSNIDSSFGHTDPFEFQVGMRQVIEGWDIGVLQLKAGSKAKIFIPSMLGYGMQGQGPKLPAFSDLIFDIEVLDARSEKPSSPGTAPVTGHEGHSH